MKTVDPLKSNDLQQFELIMKATQRQMGFTPNSMKTMARKPAILGAFSALVANILGKAGTISPLQGIQLSIKNLKWTVKNLKDPNRISDELKQLVAHMSSNASGCRYCQAHTLEAAHHAGASKEKLKTLWEFEQSDQFNEAEKSALRFAVAAGSVPNQVNASHFEDLRKHYTEAQIVELGAVVSLFGFLNRWNDTFATQLEASPMAFATEIIGEKGWEAGKHQSSSSD
ncbi:MAG: carboxymuconolactone decarboxylase family protein [Bacteroidota bacterium]